MGGPKTGFKILGGRVFFNTREKPMALRHMAPAWGDTSWEDAAHLPGSGQLGVGKAILERYALVAIRTSSGMGPALWLIIRNTLCRNAAGIPGKLRVIYSQDQSRNYKITAFENGVTYKASFVNPSNGEGDPDGEVVPDKNGDWFFPTLPVFRDWVVVFRSLKPDQPSNQSTTWSSR